VIATRQVQRDNVFATASWSKEPVTASRVDADGLLSLRQNVDLEDSAVPRPFKREQIEVAPEPVAVTRSRGAVGSTAGQSLRKRASTQPAREECVPHDIR
jgi:hypothetical protein